MPLVSLRDRPRKPLLILAACSLPLAGCAQEPSPLPAKPVSVMVPAPQPSPTDRYRPPSVQDQKINGPLGGMNKYLSDAELAALPRHLRVHFATNSSQVNAHGRRIAKDNAQFLLKFPRVDVRLEGNCDQRGTQEYNLALGDRRAESVARILEADGIPATRIQMVSFGKDNLLCDQNNASCWKRNRRVDFVYHAVLGGK